MYNQTSLIKGVGVRILTMFGLNTWLALQQLRNEQGVWNGWFGALIPLLVKQCSYTVAKLVTYDVLSHGFCEPCRYM